MEAVFPLVLPKKKKNQVAAEFIDYQAFLIP